MRTILSILFILSSLALFAQKPLVVKDIKKAMSQGTEPGMEVMIHQAQQKEVVNAWEKAIKGKSKAKAESKGDEITIIGTVLPLISNDSLNIYSYTTTSKEGTKLEVWFELKDGFINPKNEKYYLPAKKFVHDFAVSQYKLAVEEELEAEQDKLKDLEKELDKLAKDHDKLLATISKENVKIENTKNDISTNQADQERQRDLIQVQKKKVTEAAKVSEDAKKDAEKELKGLEKELSKLVKDYEGYHKDIVKSEADIREAEREVANNETARELQQNEIDKQQKLIQAVENKLAGIE